MLIEIGVAICVRAGSPQCGKIHARRNAMPGSILTGAMVRKVKGPGPDTHERHVMADSRLK